MRKDRKPEFQFLDPTTSRIEAKSPQFQIKRKSFYSKTTGEKIITEAGYKTVLIKHTGKLEHINEKLAETDDS